MPQLESMNHVSANPYAPPPTESSPPRPATSIDRMAELGRLAFRGSVDEGALREFLRHDGHVSWGRQLAIALGLALFVPAMAMMATVVLALAAAFMGIVLVMLVVSTMPYRRLVFQNINPHWAEPIEGELSSEGVQLRRRFATSFFRWDWFHEAIVGNQVVALIPATKSGQPILIARTMVSQQEQWEHLCDVARSVGVDSESNVALAQTRSQNLRMLRDKSRRRRVAVPAGAIAFEGILTIEDFDQIPRRLKQRSRPVRAYIVLSMLFFFGALFIAGISMAVFQQVLLLPALAILYIIAGALMGRLRRHKFDAQAVYYLKAIADQEGVTTDFEITTTTIPWHALMPTVWTADAVVLQRRDWQQFIVARRDMFADHQQWLRFNGLLEQHAAEPDLAST